MGYREACRAPRMKAGTVSRSGKSEEDALIFIVKLVVPPPLLLLTWVVT